MIALWHRQRSVFGATYVRNYLPLSGIPDDLLAGRAVDEKALPPHQISSRESV
jgi:hypothetical protein